MTDRKPFRTPEPEDPIVVWDIPAYLGNEAATSFVCLFVAIAIVVIGAGLWHRVMGG